MEHLAFMFYEDGAGYLSYGQSLKEDQALQNGSTNPLCLVSHVHYSIEEDHEETSLNIIMGTHQLEVAGGLHDGHSTLEQIATAIFRAGMAYGQQLTNGSPRTSDL